MSGLCDVQFKRAPAGYTHEAAASVKLTQGLRTYVFRIAYSGEEPVFTGSIYADGRRVEFERVVGADAGARLISKYEARIAELHGWTCTACGCALTTRSERGTMANRPARGQ